LNFLSFPSSHHEAMRIGDKICRCEGAIKDCLVCGDPISQMTPLSVP
jgi:hypothetical protein